MAKSKKKLRVVAIIPAHNEEDTIAGIVGDLARQTYPINNIVVVNDGSTDKTGKVLERLKRDIPQLVVVTSEEPALRAGAVNHGLRELEVETTDLVLIVDADSRIDQQLVEEAVISFEQNNRLGGVCSKSGVQGLRTTALPWWKRLEAWLLWRLQRLEYAGFDAERIATWRNVLILHGLCSVYKLKAVKSVGGFTPNHLLEDYDLTLKLKEAGWRAMYNPRMKAWTEVPTTFQNIIKQRLRWMRGGIDIILEHGINRFTAEDALAHILFVSLLLSVVLFVAFTANGNWHIQLRWHPIPPILAVAGYLISLYKLRYVEGRDSIDVLIRAVIIPELIMAVALSTMQVYAYYLAFGRRPQEW